METTQSDERFQATIREDFDFTMAHRLLTVCHAVAKTQGATHIEIVLDGVPRSNACVVGVLLLLSRLTPGKLRIRFQNCQADMLDLFHSAPLAQYFDGILPDAPAPVHRSTP